MGAPSFAKKNQGELLGCQQMATCWMKQLYLHIYLNVIDIGKKNQGFLKISNFTPHDILTSLAYIVKFELKVLSQSNELSQLLFRDSIKMNDFEIYA